MKYVLPLSMLTLLACAHQRADTASGPSRVELVEQPGMHVVEIPAPTFLIDRLVSATITRPNGEATAIDRSDLIPLDGGRYGVRVPWGLAGAVHIAMSEGTSVDFVLANTGNPRTYCAWESPLRQVSAATLFELGYGEARAVEQDTYVLMSAPHEGVALRVELLNLMGTTRVWVRAVPDDAPDAVARVDRFYDELESTLVLDGCR